MGFRTGSYAKVWEVNPRSDTRVSLRISTSRKNKQTGEYEQDFSGFVSALGTAAAKKAAALKEGDRIKLGDIDVVTRYDKENKVSYTNFNIFSFEKDESDGAPKSQSATKSFASEVDSGEIPDARLPF